jgi:hypothetical protein
MPTLGPNVAAIKCDFGQLKATIGNIFGRHRAMLSDIGQNKATVGKIRRQWKVFGEIYLATLSNIWQLNATLGDIETQSMPQRILGFHSFLRE